MNCKHLTKRTKKGIAYIYCRNDKNEITFDDCKKCLKFESRQYKLMKNKSSKIAKACDISQKVKEEVFIRDKGKCVCCGSRYAAPNAHYIRRSQGGLGIPENVVTLCFDCHHKFDNGDQREHHGNLIRKHLQMHYPNWDETKLVYDKWRKED